MEFIKDLERRNKDLHILGSFIEEKIVAYTCFGQRDSTIVSPFSSTFGGIEIISKSPSLQFIDELIGSLVEYHDSTSFSSIEITLNQKEYGFNGNVFPYLINSMFRKGFQIKDIEISSIVNLSVWKEGSRNFKRNVRIAKNEGLSFDKCTEIEQKKLCYAVIESNRRDKGFPIHLSFDYFESVKEFLDIDFFIVKSKSNETIAGAITYHVATDIVLIVYWGDLLAHRNKKAMALLAHELIHHYQSMGITYLDIGTSTKDSQPNYGLTSFKSGLGGTPVEKITLKKVLE